MKRTSILILAAALVALVVSVVTDFGDRVERARAATAATVEADFNGTQMPADMVGPHNWYAAQTFPGGATVTGLSLNWTHVNGTATYNALATDDIIDLASGTGARTVQLPDPSTVNKKVFVFLHNNGTTPSVVKATPFSINGGNSDNSLDAAADMMFVHSNGTGYVAGKSNH
jgi:hypothetical protein